MIIPCYINDPLINRWVDQIKKDLKNHYNFLSISSYDGFLKYISDFQELNKDNIDRKNIFTITDIRNHHREFISEIKSKCESSKVILITTMSDPLELLHYVKYGYNSVVEVGTRSDELATVLHKLKSSSLSIGPDLFDRIIIDKFLNSISKNDSSVNSANKDKFELPSILTSKQRVVCECLLKGYTYKEISQLLGVSFYTVNQRAKSIYKKLGINSRVQLFQISSANPTL